MAAAIFSNGTRGLITIRDVLKTGFCPSIGLSDDSVAFAANQVRVNPTQASTVTLIKTATITNVSDTTFDALITVTGSSELTNKNIYTVSPCTTNNATDAQGRVVRTLPIGVQSGDVFTIGLRVSSADNS